MTRSPVIRVGTSGWSYPSGNGTWNGVFYPPQPARRPRGRPKFDELAFYAEHFDTVEVNSSFYRVPTIATVDKWVERTPAGFEFSLKLYQKFTHPEMFARATGGDPASVGRKDVDEFLAAIEPLASAGKLGALLAQFPASFKNDPESRGYLEWLLRAFHDYPVAVELRHRSWSDKEAETAELLDAFSAALAQIDEPKFRTSIRQPLTRASAASEPAASPSRLRATAPMAERAGAGNASAPGRRGPAEGRSDGVGGSGAAKRPGEETREETPHTRGFYYLRLHGRNAAQWWKHEKSEDRYNYYYSAEELKPFATAAKAAARTVRKAYLYANNHFSAKSVANAAILKAQLGQELEGEYPPEFVDRFPDLEGMVKLLPDQPTLTALRKPS